MCSSCSLYNNLVDKKLPVKPFPAHHRGICGLNK
nr:MAG TPA: hypothetical protein [Caudoviricetes sp.]